MINSLKPSQSIPQQDKKNLFLQVRVISPNQDFYNGEALSVSSENSAGKFDILPQHANFVTMVKNKAIIIRKPNGENITFSFPLAIIYNIKDTVKIYTDIQITLPKV